MKVLQTVFPLQRELSLQDYGLTRGSLVKRCFRQRQGETGERREGRGEGWGRVWWQAFRVKKVNNWSRERGHPNTTIVYGPYNVSVFGCVLMSRMVSNKTTLLYFFENFDFVLGILNTFILKVHLSLCLLSSYLFFFHVQNYCTEKTTTLYR